MPFGRPGAETRGKPVEKLRGQRDFRQQHESLAALPQDFGDGLEINLRLARSGHAFEQGRRECAVSDAPSEIVGRDALIGVEARQAEIRVERRRARFRGQRDGGERAIRDEAVDHARRAPGERGERRFGRWRVAVGERRQDARPRIGHAGRRLACGDEAEFRRRRRGDLARADRHAQQHAARRQRPARRPIDKIAQRGPERRPVEDGGDGLEIVAAGETRGPDDAGRLPRSERHAHEGSRLELPLGRARDSCRRCRPRPAPARRRRRPIAHRRGPVPPDAAITCGAETKKPAGDAAGLARPRRSPGHRLWWVPSQ